MIVEKTPTINELMEALRHEIAIELTKPWQVLEFEKADVVISRMSAFELMTKLGDIQECEIKKGEKI